MASAVTLDKLVALCKRRGFIYQSADIYGGLTGVYDFGPTGVLLKQNICSSWIKSLMNNHDNIVQLDGAILGSHAIWDASGHVDNFSDPMVDCTNCKKRYRSDEEEFDITRPCPHCGKTAWTQPRQFNMMFSTNVGAATDKASKAYLRPETAQTIFINFKNVISTTRVKIPFGIAQIGKAFRNEITPKQFLFRLREFQQMEMEWFCKEENAQQFFEMWTKERFEFYNLVGIRKEKLRIRPHLSDELAHYSTHCNDIEYQFPFGWKELEGIANRGNFDLTQHSQASGKEFSVYDGDTKTSYIPHIIECSVGVDRLFLTLLFDAYDEDTIENETRVVLRLKPSIAPIKAACLPLTKKQSNATREIAITLRRSGYSIQFDETGSIGKRYRRQDEIGTPVCFTYDFDSENDHHVTARNRDTTKQDRIAIEQIETYLNDIITS